MANAQGYATKLALNNLLTYLDEIGDVAYKFHFFILVRW